MAAAGVASANLLTTSPQGVASPSPQARLATEPTRAMAATGAEKTGAALAPAAPIAAPLATRPAPASTVQTVQKASVETRQAPVPFQLKPRPAVNLPPVADPATEAKPSGKPDEPKPDESSSDPAADAAGQNAARAAIEADGYKSVKVLRKGVNGVWHASALRGKTAVTLTVDAGGSVSAD